MTDPDDTDNHDFTRQDVDTILGVVEPADPSTSSPGAVDPTVSEAERAAQVQRAIVDLLANGADPELVRHLAALSWHQGWCAAAGTSAAHPAAGVSRNPYDDPEQWSS